MAAAVEHMQGGDGFEPVVLPELDEQQFTQWAALLEQRLGIEVSVARRHFLASRLRMRMRELGLTDFQRYYELVSSPRAGQVEWLKLLDRLTIHETRFNRNPASFRLIEEFYLPMLLRNHAGATPSIHAWSVGCASGEEAYNLAIILERAITAHGAKGYFGVIGTDISLASLAEARRARYAPSRLAQLDSETRERYFTFDAGEYQVVEKIRERVCFSQLNVQRLENAPMARADIIFCQNLLIYFSQEMRRKIVQELIGFMKPGALLVLGIGELVGWKPVELRKLDYKDTLAYQKVME